ncbi:MAG: hypothetical protein ACI4RA_03840 [Kiritimatiellia bacterium]
MKMKLGCLSLVCAAAVFADPAPIAQLDETDMFPFVPSYESPKNVVDMSHLLEAPAGRSGRIRVKDGHFVNDKGRVRLHATNLTGPANFPTHAEAERLAARLARFGVNCVRLHYFDSGYGTFMLPEEQGILAEDFRTRRRFDPKQRDRQDYLIAQFKKRGIYVDMNLHVARTLDARDGFAPGTPWANKGVDQFDPRIIAEEKAYAKELLEHVNPYTGMSYLKDPVVALVELNNEDALWNQYLGGGMDNLGQPYATVFRNLWNDWLCRKYGSAEAMQSAWALKSVPKGEELIAEGAFDGEVKVDGKNWILDKGTAKASVASAAGALRVTVAEKGTEFFPKLYRRVAVKKDVPYTVKFRIRRVSGAAGEVGFAVADRREGWASLGVLARFAPGVQWKTHEFSFYSPDDVEKAEIQFTRFGQGGVYEIDDLSFKTGCDFASLEGLSPLRGEVPIVKGSGTAPMPMLRDFYQFLVDTERAYWTGMQKYLQQELGLEAPVSATQLGYSPPHVQAELDFVDNHAYWQHPSINKNWKIGNSAMVNAKGGCVAALAAARVAGKPYTVSEYNHPYPNFYGAEGQPMLRAYGALQGWDGVFEYSYNNRQNAEPVNNEYFFSLAARSDVLAHFPACAAIYLRGDVKESATQVVGNLPYDKYFDRLCRHRQVGQVISSSEDRLPFTLGLVHGVAVDVTGKSAPVTETYAAPGAVAVSDTRELCWNNEDAKNGYWTVDTPNTKLFTGFPKGRTVELGGVKIAVGRTKLGWATVSLVSHDATGFGETGAPASILLTATGLSHNGGAKFTDCGGGAISCRGADWGTGKTVCEGVNATITLPSAPAKTKCWALDEAGARRAEVPVVDANGQASVVIGPSYRTVWYEIEVK